MKNSLHLAEHRGKPGWRTKRFTRRLKVLRSWRGPVEALVSLSLRQNAAPENNRLAPVFQALANLRVRAEPAVYHDKFCEETRQQLMRVNVVLVWMNPIQDGRRSILDSIQKYSEHPHTKEATMPNHKKIPFSGTVTARNCPTCGHHEIGLVSENGVFRPLRTGTKVVIMDEMEPAQIPTQGGEAHATCKTREEPSNTLEGSYWVPEPLKGDRRMRLKYGVVIQREFGSVPVTEHIYESAYMQKLSYLLENEVNIPIAVILDRFFVAPHLASGESGDMANNMWGELEEIRQPVEQVTQWLKEPDEKTLQLLLQPGAIENLEKQPVSEETALEELRALSLEDFLALL